MIGYLNGKIELKDSPYVFLDVHGVGYKVFVSPNYFSVLIAGEGAKMFTFTHVREDILDLYGFAHPLDLKLFENLIGVSGIGPKTAIGIFSFGTRIEIIEAILKGDVDFFTKVPRLGRKNAQKIIIELKNKFGDGKDLDLSSGLSDKDDAVLALKTFGFSTQEANEALKKFDKNLSTEEKVKQALKSLGK
jgi:Holliday junction DNA helicase RuvA